MQPVVPRRVGIEDFAMQEYKNPGPVLDESLLDVIDLVPDRTDLSREEVDRILASSQASDDEFSDLD